MMKPPVVLDSWALLAWLQAEQPAAASVRGLLDEAAAGERLAVLSIINAGEVFYIIAKGLAPAKATDIPDQLTLLPATSCRRRSGLSTTTWCGPLPG